MDGEEHQGQCHSPPDWGLSGGKAAEGRQGLSQGSASGSCCVG